MSSIRHITVIVQILENICEAYVFNYRSTLTDSFALSKLGLKRRAFRSVF